MTKPQYFHATAAKLRALAIRDDFELEISYHCKTQLRARDIQLPDVLRVLASGTVVNEELHDGEMRYSVDGRDIDGKRLTAIVAFDEEKKLIMLVSVWKKSE